MCNNYIRRMNWTFILRCGCRNRSCREIMKYLIVCWSAMKLMCSQMSGLWKCRTVNTTRSNPFPTQPSVNLIEQFVMCDAGDWAIISEWVFVVKCMIYCGRYRSLKTGNRRLMVYGWRGHCGDYIVAVGFISKPSDNRKDPANSPTVNVNMEM